MHGAEAALEKSQSTAPRRRRYIVTLQYDGTTTDALVALAYRNVTVLTTAPPSSYNVTLRYTSREEPAVPRDRQYRTNADRQRAYRERKAARDARWQDEVRRLRREGAT